MSNASQSWVKPVGVDGIKEGVEYFIGREPLSRLSQWTFYAELKSGKRQWSSKPGLAIRYVGCDKLRKEVSKHEGVACVEVPANAEKRWRSRK